MIQEISRKIVDYLEIHNYLKEEREIYEYGCRSVISSMIGTILILIIGFMTNHPIEAILYEVVISSSRSILGGYHCKSYRSCIITYVNIFAGGLIISHYIKVSWVILLFIEMIGLLITVFLCPVENVNMRLSDVKKTIFNKYSIMYVFILINIINVMFIFDYKYVNIFIYIFMIIHILTVGGVVDNGKDNE